MRRVGVFGGSFDPPHMGHVAVARAAADAFALETVLFLPTGRQPLKQAKATPFADRLAMVRLLLTLDARFAVSEADGPRPDGGPNYTVEALREIRRTMPDAALFAIAGADSFLDLRRWREPEALLTLAEWIVVSRPGFSLGDLSSLKLSPGERTRVHLLETVHEPVSATALRASLAAGKGSADALPPEVLGYIEAHELYSSLKAQQIGAAKRGGSATIERKGDYAVD